MNTIFMWMAELLPLFASSIAFTYGAIHFNKKGKALYLQIIIMAMGCYALGDLYHLCQMLTINQYVDGFTAAYLGRMGFYLFLFTANYGQMDGLLDDGSEQMAASRLIGLLGPILAILMYIYCAFSKMPLSTKITYGLVWIPAMLSMYYNLKHAVIPDLGFGFAKAVRPYNISAFILSVVDLFLLCSWANYSVSYGYLRIVIVSAIFAVMCFFTIRNLEKGVKKWTI